MRPCNTLLIALFILIGLIGCQKDDNHHPCELPLLVGHVTTPIWGVLFGVDIQVEIAIYNITLSDCPNSTAGESHALFKAFRRDSENMPFELVMEKMLKIPAIPPNENFTSKVPLNLGEAGQYQFQIIKDVFDEVTEQGE